MLFVRKVCFAINLYFTCISLIGLQYPLFFIHYFSNSQSTQYSFKIDSDNIYNLPLLI